MEGQDIRVREENLSVIKVVPSGDDKIQGMTISVGG